MDKMKKILVVDDESDICLTLATVLEDNRFVVRTFDNPLLAMENFRKELYDLLILDVKMDKMNGLELYREIKNHCAKSTSDTWFGLYVPTDYMRKISAVRTCCTSYSSCQSSKLQNISKIKTVRESCNIPSASIKA